MVQVKNEFRMNLFVDAGKEIVAFAGLNRRCQRWAETAC